MRLADIRRIYPHEILLVEFVSLTSDLQVEEGEVLAHSHNKADIYKAFLAAKDKQISLEYPKQAFDNCFLLRSDANLGSVPTEKMVLVRAAVTGVHGTALVNLLAGFPWEPSYLAVEIVQAVGLNPRDTQALERSLAIKRDPEANVIIASLKLFGKELTDVAVRAGPMTLLGPVDGYLGKDIPARLRNTVLSRITVTQALNDSASQPASPAESEKGEFVWLHGGPLLEVGFLAQLQTSREEFLSDFVAKLNQTAPKVEIVSHSIALNKSKKEFLNGYPWDPEDKNTVYVHSWGALAQVQFGEKRESSLTVHQISDTSIHVSFYFWGDLDDGWGQKGVKNNDLPGFVALLKSLSRLYKFAVGTISFGISSLFLFTTHECWPHPDYNLKNLTPEIMEANSDKFTLVLARKDFLDAAANTLEYDGYVIVKIDDVLQRANHT